MSSQNSSTLRLVLPQWQGGDDPAYQTGAQILSALLPEAVGPVARIDVPRDGDRRPQVGIKSRETLLQLHDAARTAIDAAAPRSIVTVGGDCLADLAPVAYLNEIYGDGLAVLWIDTHPDILTAAEFSHAHAHVLAMLMGEGDPDFVARVPKPLDPSQVLYVGLHDLMPQEADYITKKGMSVLSPADLAASPQPVADWLAARGATHVAVHFDIDVLDPARHGYTLFNKPVPAGTFDGIAQGQMDLAQVAAILEAAGAQAEMVGLAITEFLPWPMIELAQTFARLPLISRS